MVEIQIVVGNEDDSRSLVLNLIFFGNKLINFLLDLWNTGMAKIYWYKNQYSYTIRLSSTFCLYDRNR